MRESSRNRTRMTNSSGARTAPTHVHSERQVRHPQRRVSTVDFRIGHDARATEHQSRFLSFLKSLLRDFITSVHAGRITKTVRSRRLKEAKNPSNCFHGKYFLLSNCIPRAASSPVTILARASTHSPSTLPRMSHGAIFTRGLFRTRFTFPETPIVYTYSFASFESRLADGSAANHTGVFTPSPLFLKVSRLRYLCPANAANPIASLLGILSSAGRGGRAGAVPLRGVTHNQAHDGSRDNDPGIVVVHAKSNKEGKEESQKKAECDSARHRFHFACKKAAQQSGQKSLPGRSDNDSHNARPNRGIRSKERRQPVEHPENRTKKHTQQDLVHEGLLCWSEILSLSKHLYNERRGFFAVSDRRAEGGSSA